MDRNECFPLFFAISAGPSGQYKVFQNNIYQAFETLDMPANILWPVDGVSLGALSKVTAPSSKLNYTFIRKWNGKHYRSCSWTHTGSEVELNIDGETRVIPVVSINCEADALPFNNAVMKTKSKPLPIVPRFPVSSKMPVMSY